MRINKRRRRESKTDYLKRLKILKGNFPRIVFRKTNKYVFAQYVTSREAQDKIEFGIDSKKLLEYGWPKEASGSLKSITASYFLGLLTGEKIIEKKLKIPIIDFGMIRAVPKSKIYAFLKGLIDAGIKMKCKEEVFPGEERIKGKHMKNKILFERIKQNIEKNEK